MFRFGFHPRNKFVEVYDNSTVNSSPYYIHFISGFNLPYGTFAINLDTANGGVCTLLRMAVDYPELVAIPLKPSLQVNAGIGWRKNSYISLATRAFIGYLLEDADS